MYWAHGLGNAGHLLCLTLSLFPSVVVDYLFLFLFVVVIRRILLALARETFDDELSKAALLLAAAAE